MISKYSKIGYQIYVVILTNANIGAPELFSKKLIENIRKEATIANRLIGTKIIFRELPALNLYQISLYKISNLIEKYILKINPETIFIPSKRYTSGSQNNI